MSVALSVPEGDHDRLHLFVINMIEAEARILKSDPKAAEKLLCVPINPDFAELVRLKDLDDLSLSNYLEQGYDIPPANLQSDLRRLNAVEGLVLVVLSRAFGTAAVDIKTSADVTYLGSYDTTPTDWDDTADLRAKSAAPFTAPKEAIQKRPSDGAMMGRIATVVLIVLFALTGLMVWIAG